MKTTLRIAIDLRPLQTSHARRGIGRWLSEFTGELGRCDTTSHYILLWEGLSPAPQLFKNQRIFRVPKKIPGVRWITDYLLTPLYVKLCAADFYVSADYMAYPKNYTRTKILSVVHDFLPLSLPDYKWRTRLGCRLNFNNLHKHDHLFVVSDYTHREVAHYLDEPLPPISKIGVGVNRDCFKPAGESEVQQYCNKHQLENYLVYIGESNYRKNIARLLQAVDKLSEDVVLLLVGQGHPTSQEVHQEIQNMQHPERIRFMGYVPDEELGVLLSGAKALVFPSLAEGFGLPVIEAMACGTPVITSNCSSLPEAAGSAALLVDPTSVEDIQCHIERLLQSRTLQKELSQKGLQHINAFSWKQCAQRFLEVIHKK